MIKPEHYVSGSGNVHYYIVNAITRVFECGADHLGLFDDEFHNGYFCALQSILANCYNENWEAEIIPAKATLVMKGKANA